MDTSVRPQIRSELGVSPAVTPSWFPQGTWISAATIARGPDALVNILLHESLHGAGVPEGVGGLAVFESAMQLLTTQAGFPIDQGGATVRAEVRRTGSTAVRIVGSVEISRQPTEPPLLYLATAYDGSIIDNKPLPGSVGTHPIDMIVHLHRHTRYALRVREGAGMMGSTMITTP